ncbi:hypothetical protein XA68_14486 [Ophiocordyceps unilateralis]|uniref:Ig-like domain-containing protein n=1 Tax=Ophiocordyceps unilateralis TaxID=268505 RepID=A0A2A9P957_OPHUN|nr:hypothetical protein XA68_14486 [Ophiocordyceps unilateralis]
MNLGFLFICLFVGPLVTQAQKPGLSAIDALEGRQTRNVLVEILKKGFSKFVTDITNDGKADRIPQPQVWSRTGAAGRHIRHRHPVWSSPSSSGSSSTSGSICKRGGDVCVSKSAIKKPPPSRSVIKKAFFKGLRKVGLRWAGKALQWVWRIASKLSPKLRIAGYVIELIGWAVEEVFEILSQAQQARTQNPIRRSLWWEESPVSAEERHAERFAIWWGLQAKQEVDAVLQSQAGRGKRATDLGRRVTEEDIDTVAAYRPTDPEYLSDAPATNPQDGDLGPVELLMMACASSHDLVLEEAREVCEALGGGRESLDEEKAKLPTEIIDCKASKISWQNPTEQAQKVGRGEMECKAPGGTEELTMRWWRGEVLEKCKVEDGGKWCTSWKLSDDWSKPNFGLPAVAVQEAAKFGIPSLPPNPRRRGRPLGPTDSYGDDGKVVMSTFLRDIWTMVMSACDDWIFQPYCEVQRQISNYAYGESDESKMEENLKAFYMAMFPRRQDSELSKELEDYQQMLLVSSMCVQVGLAFSKDEKNATASDSGRDVFTTCIREFGDQARIFRTQGLKLWAVMVMMAQYIKGGWMNYFDCRLNGLGNMTTMTAKKVEINCFGDRNPELAAKELEDCQKRAKHLWDLDDSVCKDDGGGDKAEPFTALDKSTWFRTRRGLKRCSTSEGQQLCSLLDPASMSKEERSMALTSGIPLEADKGQQQQQTWKDAESTSWAWKNGSLQGCDEKNKCNLFQVPGIPYKELQKAKQAGVPGLPNIRDASESAIDCSGLWKRPKSELTQKVINGTQQCGSALDAWWWEDKCFLHHCVWQGDFGGIPCYQYHPYRIPPEMRSSAEKSGVLPQENQLNWIQYCDKIKRSTKVPAEPEVDKKKMAKNWIQGTCTDSTGNRVECGAGLTWETYHGLRRRCNGFWNRATAKCLPMKVLYPERRTNYHVDERRQIFRCPEGREKCDNDAMIVEQGKAGWGGIYNPTPAMMKRWKHWTE